MYSRLLLLLGVVSILAGLLLSVIGAVIVAAVFHENGAGIAVTMVISAFTFGTPAAVFLTGSGAMAYLAARSDRESGEQLVSAVAQIEAPPPPVPGIVPKMDLGDYEDHKNDDT